MSDEQEQTNNVEQTQAMPNVNGNKQNENPLLRKIQLPPTTQRLPSRGLLYTNNELSEDVHDGEINIYPFTGEDEIELKSPDLLLSGDAVCNVIRRRCPAVKHPMELFLKDVDFIMLILRITSYGSQMEIPYTHDCENAQEHKYTVNLDQVKQQIKYIDPATISETYTTTTSTNQTVSFRPMRMKHLIEMMQTNDDDSPEFQRQNILKSLATIIEDVDGVIDEQNIIEWLRELPRQDVQVIREKIEETGNWGPIFESEIECLDCGNQQTIPINTNPLVFFT